MFAGVLAVLFAAAAVAGGAIDPKGADEDPAPHGGGHGATAPATGHDDGGHEAPVSAAAESQPVRGLAVAANGLRLVVDDPQLARGRTEQLEFRIVDDRGATVRNFDVEHTKRMHVIVVRRDMRHFQHVHPRQTADGAWTVPVRLDEAGAYRVFADFTRAGVAATLAADLRVDGAADLAPLPEPRTQAVADGGYRVRLTAGSPRPGSSTPLRFAVTRGGESVHVEPYLGADGHLVALREGDLAYLHVHPSEGHEASGGHDDAIGFEATFPTAGRYRLFLQFRHEGRVRTVAFTQEVS